MVELNHRAGLRPEHANTGSLVSLRRDSTKGLRWLTTRFEGCVRQYELVRQLQQYHLARRQRKRAPAATFGSAERRLRVFEGFSRSTVQPLKPLHGDLWREPLSALNTLEQRC